MKPCSAHVAPARVGFTLVELLVLVGMLGLLATMLGPAMARTKPNSASFQCQNNFRQLAFAWKMYADDNNGSLVFIVSFSFSPRLTLSLNADAVEIRPAVRARGVGIDRRAGPADEVALERGKRRRRGEIRGALQKIRPCVHALPTDGGPGHVVGGGKHFQDGQGVGGVGPGNPFLPVVHAVAICVSEIRRAVRG